MADDQRASSEAAETRIRYAARLQRAQGCLLGQLTGDALGSMVEFQSKADIALKYPGGLRDIGPSPVWGTIAGQPTDDSEIALALARSMLPHGYSEEAVARAYGEWRLSEPFDIGNTVRQAVDAIVAAISEGQNASEAARKASNPHSEANGALMRQSPLAIWGSWIELETLDSCVRSDTTLTHPSQVCQDASASFVVALAATVRDGLDARAAYDFALEWDRKHGSSPTVTDALEAADSHPPNYERHQGHVLIALQNAFYQALHASTFEEGVVATVMAGGDTDTNAAIAGALLGAIHGVDAIPHQWREVVLNCRPERGVPWAQRPRPEEFWPVDALELADRLLSAGIGSRSRWEKMNNPRTTEELIELALAEKDEEKQTDLIEVLQYRGTYEVLEVARELCKAPEPKQRVIGAWILGQNMVAEKTHHNEAIETLLGMLEREENPEVLQQVAFSMGSRGDARAVEPLVQLKNHPHEEVRYGVVHGLSGQDHPAAVAALIELSADVDSDVRDWATFRLGMLEDAPKQALDALAARIADEDDDTRAEAIVGLARNKDQRAIEPLIEYLAELKAGDKDWAYIEDLLYEAATELADPRLCLALLKIKSQISDDKYLDEALEKCGCELQ